MCWKAGGIGYINGEPQIFEPGARFHMPARLHARICQHRRCAAGSSAGGKSGIHRSGQSDR